MKTLRERRQEEEEDERQKGGQRETDYKRKKETGRKTVREGWSVIAHVRGVENNKKAAAAKHVYKLV